LMGGAAPRAPFTALGSLGALEAHRLWPFLPQPGDKEAATTATAKNNQEPTTGLHHGGR
jgi:hypothetical protein